MEIDNDILYGRCPCGSGKSLKFCCWKKIRDQLPPHAGLSDVVAAVRRSAGGAEAPSIGDERVTRDVGALLDIKEAQDLLTDGKYEKAAKLFHKIRKAYPEFLVAWNNEILATWMSGKGPAAVRLAGQALKQSGEANAFGWGLLAQLRYLTGDTPGAAGALDRAAAIIPPTEEAAAKVCHAMALLRQHQRLVEYARTSMFGANPVVATLSGIAAANLGDRPGALRRLRGAASTGATYADYARSLLGRLEAGETAESLPLGEWPYFQRKTYEAGVALVDALTRRREQDANMVCDYLGILLYEGRIAPGAALAVASAMEGDRAAALRAQLAARGAVAETAPPFDDKEAVSKFLVGKAMEDYGLKLVQSKVDAAPPDDFAQLSKADYDAYTRALEMVHSTTLGSKDWAAARETFRDIANRNHGFHRALFTWAGMLRAEGLDDEARKVFERIRAEHPEYAHAAAALLMMALDRNDMDGALEIVRSYEMPETMHPQELLAWFTALREYWRAKGDRKQEKELSKSIRDIEKQFDLESGSTFVRVPRRR
ncbi:MAG: hypothetical protein IKQ55_12940 [Kiritimatiellae bacterium]|nr:hypothetical protein [Kiritimatiellia bacterium]